MIDAGEPVLWVAIVVASVAAVLLGQAVGRKAAVNGGKRGIGLAALDLAVFLPLLLISERVLLSLLFALRTGGGACIPLVRLLLLIPVGVGILAAVASWHRTGTLARA